jgi:hypothetical protein
MNERMSECHTMLYQPCHVLITLVQGKRMYAYVSLFDALVPLHSMSIILLSYSYQCHWSHHLI